MIKLKSNYKKEKFGQKIDTEGRQGEDTRGEDGYLNGVVHPQAKDCKPTAEARRDKDCLLEPPESVTLLTA